MDEIKEKKEKIEKEKRKKHNDDLLRRFKKGENILNYNSSDTWFPPRPVIKKDKDLVKKLYGDDAEVIGNKKPYIDLVKEDGV